MIAVAQCPLSTHHAVLRTLGIPSRPLSNFVSAHDTDANRAVDYYYDESYNLISDLSADSIWWVLIGWVYLTDVYTSVMQLLHHIMYIAGMCVVVFS